MKTRIDTGVDTATDDGPSIRQIDTHDLKEVLRKGLDDFNARPTHVVFLCVIYPVVAILLTHFAFNYDLLPLLFPMVSGFALVGPLAATGLYELSRRREEGRDYAWWHVFDVVHAPSRWSLAALGLVMAALFIVWLQAALIIYRMFFGETASATAGDFINQVFTTPEGWGLILVGCGVGLIFAAVVFAISIVSLPMLLDKKTSATRAVTTSIAAVKANPKPMLAWAVIVVAALIIGSLPFFVGLAVVLPVLGHATWHLYRKLVVT